MAMALMLLCCGCTLNVLRPSGEPATNVPNPIVNVDSAEAFAGTGVSIDAPVDAGDVSYSIIDGTLAQVSFTYDSLEYIYRASASATDIDGIYYNKRPNTCLALYATALMLTPPSIPPKDTACSLCGSMTA